jgi:general nucleoside transport system ATP-binding protein
MSHAAATVPATGYALECHGVSVSFGPVAALREVSVGFTPGRIHAVVGQNGAGKTTFARVCAGLIRPDTGMLRVAGRDVATGHVNEARAAGVELVHQSFALPPSFTVAEAMEFGSTRHGGRPYSRAALEARWRPHLESLGLTVRARDRIRDLPVESQQAVEIARALVTDAKVLILDEPTAVLSPSGIETLFERLRGLKRAGVTVILILHKIREVLGVADTVTVLRGGRHVAGPLETSDVSAHQLAGQIIGAAPAEAGDLSGSDRAALVGEGEAEVAAATHLHVTAPSVLSMRGLSTRPDAEGRSLDNVTLALRRGEIVGVAGVEGNGQRPLVQAFAGLASVQAGQVMLGDTDVTRAPPLARRDLGLRIIPFERNSEGLSLSSSLWENWSARALLGGSALRLINPGRLRNACETSLRQWDVRFATTTQNAGSLSGGNAQKVILAREMDADATAVIAAQPTRGLDIGATAFVWRALRDARARGCGVLLISSDLDELFDICDRIVVMLSGRIAGEFEPPYSLHDIGQAMTGAAQ